jgi:hypothetical protein
MVEPVSPGLSSRTQEQLRILSIAHYVVGALHALFASFGLIHFSMGVWMLISPQSFSGKPEDMGIFVGVLFTVLGAIFVLGGWTLGAVTILSGRYIAQRKKRTFSFIVGGINCVFLPLGTVLGIFDLILLTRDDVRQEYGETP